jgi:hypothetical protein
MIHHGHGGHLEKRTRRRETRDVIFLEPEPMLELHAKIQKFEAELDKAVDAAWGEA